MPPKPVNRDINKYTLKVTAGSSRPTSSHKSVPVNTETPLKIETEHVSTDLYVRVQGFRNPHNPSTSPYFSTSPHEKDKYSISFSPLVFKEDVNGDDLVLGNDFDNPINKNLPPGFGVAWKVARWVVDPGLDGDPYSEKPWLEGRVLSSVNVIDYGDDTTLGGGKEAKVLTEGLGSKHPSLTLAPTDDTSDDNTGGETIPPDAPARMKFFLTESRRKGFVFKKGEKYHLDFYNPYIDFNDFALHLPGISIHILQYWDGQPLRYVLRNRVSGEVYGVVSFMLEEIEKDGDDEDEDEEEESGEEGDYEDAEEGDQVDEKKANEILEKAKKAGGVQTSEDDVD